MRDSPTLRASALALAMLALAVMPATAQQRGAAGVALRPRAQPRTIHVTATGTVRIKPDRLVLRLAVETTATTATSATSANAARMARVVQALVRLGIPRTRIRTTSYGLQPRYRRQEPGASDQTPTIVGYRAMNTLEVILDDITRAGSAVDEAIGAGANRVDGLSWSLQDPSAARLQALDRAMKSAHAEAETLARAAGETLGPVQDISTSGGMPGPIYEGVRAAALQAVTPVEPGQLTVSATVSAVFRIGTP